MRGIIPLPKDNMNEFVFNTGSRSIITNVSSNGYYGYQPQINAPVKNSVQNGQSEQEANGNCDIDMEYNHLEEINVHLQNNIPRQYNRKRRWEQAGEVVTFKKRREYEDNKSNLKSELPKGDKEGKLLEDILRETHGAMMYHWLCNEA